MPAVLTGTITNDDEIIIRTIGNSTIILTLTGDTYVASGGTFDAQRQAIIDGIVSASSQSNGWNDIAVGAIPVGNVVRTSDTIVTITVPIVPGYRTTVNDGAITATIPGAALVGGSPIVATPTFTITDKSECPPVVEGKVTSSSGSIATSTIIDLPLDIVAEELLIAGIAIDGNFPITWPAGWTEGGEIISGSLVSFSVGYREATGGETSVTVTHGAAISRNSIAYRISGVSLIATQAPEFVFIDNGDSTSHDPPNIVPTGGQKDYLFIVMTGVDEGEALTDFPLGYTDTVNHNLGFVTIGAAQKDDATTSEDPGAFIQTNSAQAGSVTIAVHPGIRAIISGTIVGDDEADIRAGGSILTITLLRDTWVAVGSAFDAERQNIIDGIDSNKAESNGWDAIVKAGLQVTDVVRTNDTVVTITLPVFANYTIVDDETITVTVPASALVIT